MFILNKFLKKAANHQQVLLTRDFVWTNEMWEETRSVTSCHVTSLIHNNHMLCRKWLQFRLFRWVYLHGKHNTGNMKELFIISSIYVFLVVFDGTEAIREGNKWSKVWRQEQNIATVKWKRNIAHKPKHNNRLKVEASHQKNDASQKKRQFVPGVPNLCPGCLNFPHPHIHRIIVHHHPGRSIAFRALLILTMRGHKSPPGLKDNEIGAEVLRK